MKRKIKLFFSESIRILYLIMFLFIWGTLLFSEKMCEKRPPNRHNAPSNKLLLIGVIILIFLSLWIGKYIADKMHSISLRMILGVGALVLYVLQVVIIVHIWFYTDWDCGSIRWMSRDFIQYGEFDNWYISIYPNNAGMTFATITLLKIFSFLGDIEKSYFAMILTIAMLVNLSAVLSADCVYRLTCSKKASLLAWGLVAILAVMSPWIIIPYTDTMTIMIPIAIFSIYLRKEQFSSPYFFWLSIGALSAIGYCIKPTCIIMLIAILIISIIQMERFSIVNILYSSIGIVMSLLLILAGDNYIKYAMFDVDTQQSIPMVHFVMMGLNGDTWGAFSGEDFQFSREIEGKEERIKGDIDRLKNRIAEHGAIGLWLQLQKKTLMNYNDGSFAWGNEGKFYEEEKGLNTQLAQFLRNVFYHKEGKYYHYLFTCEHIVWLMVLGLAMFGTCRINNCDDKLMVLRLALIGIFIFESLFEARARYLYLYIPAFCAVAACGWSNLDKWRLKR